MSIESRIVRSILGWFWRRYRYQMIDIVIGQNSHVHKNPVRRKKTVPDVYPITEQ